MVQLFTSTADTGVQRS